MNKRIILMLGIVVFLGAGKTYSQESFSPTKVEKAKYFDKTIPLRDMKVIVPGERDRTWKDGIIENKSLFVNPDDRLYHPVVNPPETQTVFGTTGSRGPVQNFEGVGNVNGVYPPDTDGDVGPDHYFQMINLSFAIWDKDGTLLYGPVDNSTLWAGFIGPWTGTNDGDPIILYDEEADRWVATQFAVNLPNGKSYELVAVSETGDPLGSYYRYAFEFDYMNDYPKFGVWRDGYYSSYHMFGGGYRGGAFAVMNRDKMLVGDPDAEMIYFGEYGSIYGLMPADVDGDFPPVGSPNYFMDIGDSHNIDLWALSVDWNTPSNSTLNMEISLTPDAFSTNINGIPQPGTSEKLDVLAGMIMNRLQYRNFGTYETLVTNHTIYYYGRAAIRWYELRRTGGTWSIYQQGTYSPDDTYRWMGSAAMNANGDIAIGYSVSSSSVYPSIRYAGRRADAPLGELNLAEMEVKAGLSSQTNISRWGDYSCINIDPVDDTTFWFTTEYRKNSGWGTWITSFDFDAPIAPVLSAGPDDTICKYQFFHPDATVSHQQSVQWVSSGNGIFSNPTSITTTYAHGSQDLAAGQATLSVTATGFGAGLVSEDSVLLIINNNPMAFAGNDTLICAGEDLVLNAEAENFSTVLWETNGDGTFADDTMVNTTYTPGPDDISNQSVLLTLNANPIPPCEDEDIDKMVLTIEACTGTEEISETELAIVLVPNPSDGLFTFVIDQGSKSDLKISIMNLQGQILFTQRMEPSDEPIEKQIDMSYYSNGTYLFKVESDEKVSIQKLILQ